MRVPVQRRRFSIARAAGGRRSRGAASLGFLGLAVRQLPIGPAYTVWTGLGAVGVTLIAALAYGDTLSKLQLLCMLMILAGVAGLKLSA